MNHPNAQLSDDNLAQVKSNHPYLLTLKWPWHNIIVIRMHLTHYCPAVSSSSSWHTTVLYCSLKFIICSWHSTCIFANNCNSWSNSIQKYLLESEWKHAIQEQVADTSSVLILTIQTHMIGDCGNEMHGIQKYRNIRCFFLELSKLLF